MRVNRFFHPDEFNVGETLTLSKDVSNHITRVLRIQDGEQIELFNGDGYNYLASIKLDGKKVQVALLSRTDANNESSLSIHLGQAISRGERMEFTLQKAVELGVTQITPLVSERVQFRYDDKRLAKKMGHWQRIIESACEQCGRAVIPTLNSVQNLMQWVKNESGQGLLFVPDAKLKLTEIETANQLRLLVGPEGGFSDQEISSVLRNEQFTKVSLGPRILRTETAALAAISILQAQFGDL